MKKVFFLAIYWYLKTFKGLSISEKTMSEISFFGRKFTELYRDSLTNSILSDDDKANLYGLSGFIKDLLKLYMSFTPLWTVVAIYHKDSRKTR